MKTNIVVDCDGVIFNFISAFKNLASEMFHREMDEISSHWSLEKRFGMTGSEVEEVFQFMREKKLWGSIPMYEGALESLHALSNHEGINLSIVTGINPDENIERAECLQNAGFNAPVIAVGRNVSKLDTYKALNADIVIDDYMKHLNEAKIAGADHRLLINSCQHAEDTSNSTASFNSLHEAYPFVLEVI